MEQENHSPVPEAAPAEEPSGASLLPENASSASPAPGADPEEYRGVDWAFIGDNGLRAGWSVLIFVPIYFIALFTLGTAASLIVGNIVHNRLGSGTALSAGIGELVPFFAMLIAAAIVGLIEHRSILDFKMCIRDSLRPGRESGGCGAGCGRARRGAGRAHWLLH